MIIICDIDGVLADNSHRLPLVLCDEEKRDYERYYSNELVQKDKPIKAGVRLVNQLRHTKHRVASIWFSTARNNKCRAGTYLWLCRTIGQGLYGLIMRHEKDFRPSYEVKVEQVGFILEQEGCDNNPIYFIDDDPRNVEAVCTAYPNITGITFGIRRPND